MAPGVAPSIALVPVGLLSVRVTLRLPSTTAFAAVVTVNVWLAMLAGNVSRPAVGPVSCAAPAVALQFTVAVPARLPVRSTVTVTVPPSVTLKAGWEKSNSVTSRTSVTRP